MLNAINTVTVRRHGVEIPVNGREINDLVSLVCYRWTQGGRRLVVYVAPDLESTAPHLLPFAKWAAKDMAASYKLDKRAKKDSKGKRHKNCSCCRKLKIDSHGIVYTFGKHFEVAATNPDGIYIGRVLINFIDRYRDIIPGLDGDVVDRRDLSGARTRELVRMRREEAVASGSTDSNLIRAAGGRKAAKAAVEARSKPKRRPEVSAELPYGLLDT